MFCLKLSMEARVHQHRAKPGMPICSWASESVTADAHDAGAYSGADDVATDAIFLDARADAAADARAYPGDGTADA